MPLRRTLLRLAPTLLVAWASIATAASPVIKIRVAPSGQGFAVEAFGPDGVSPTAITGFGGVDEVQALTFSGTPKGQAFTLRIDGKTTAPIPFRRVPPSSAFTFNVALPAPGSYDVQVNVPFPRGTPAPNNYTVYDGVVPLGPPVDVA